MRPTRTTVETLRRSLLRLVAPFVLVVGLAVGAPGCAAPTLPLPPPTALVSAPDEDGFVEVSGVSRPLAIVMGFNEDRRAGVIAEAGEDGAYSLRIQASIGETITVWQMVGSDTSQLVSRVVPDR